MDKSQPPQYIPAQNYVPAEHYIPTQPTQASTTIIVQKTSVPVGNESTRITCPSCGASIMTDVTHKASTRTHIFAFLLCLFGLNIMDKSQPPPYFTPAQVYQPEQPPAHLYSPMPQQSHMQQPPQMPPQQSTLIIQTATPITVALGDTPARTTCPSCRADIVTSVKHSATCKTHCCALFLCCFFCWPCVCIPYCMDSCQNADHYCPNCNSFIGTHEN